MLEGTIRLDVGTVPAIWVQLPAEFERERGRFEVERREGLRADVFGIRFAAGTCWVAVPSSVAGEARRAGKLAVFTQPPLDVEDPGEAPYFTIDFYG